MSAKVLVNGVETLLPSSANYRVLRRQDRLVVLGPNGATPCLAVAVGGKTLISYGGSIFEVEMALRARSRTEPTSGEVVAPMPGAIVEVLVEIGAVVRKGQKLLVLEAMKMQQPIVAPFDGTVTNLNASTGHQVTEGTRLVTVTQAELGENT